MHVLESVFQQHPGLRRVPTRPHPRHSLRSKGDVSFFTYLPCTSAGLDTSFLVFLRDSILADSARRRPSSRARYGREPAARRRLPGRRRLRLGSPPPARRLRRMLAALSTPAAAQSLGSSSREVSRLSAAARGRRGTGPRPPTRAMVRRREPLALRPPPTSGKLSPRRWECRESRRRAGRPSPRRARTRLRAETRGGRLTGRGWRPPRSSARLRGAASQGRGRPEPAKTRGRCRLGLLGRPAGDRAARSRSRVLGDHSQARTW